MDYSSFSNWNSLPNEIKFMIMKKLDYNSRLALRVCSKNDKELVDCVKYRKIAQLRVFPMRKEMIIVRTPFGMQETFKFDSFESFQNKLTKEIEENDSIERMSFDLMTRRVNIYSKHDGLVKVRRLDIGCKYRTYIMGLIHEITSPLKQVDPFYLEILKLQNIDDQAIFDIQQVIHVKKLSVNENVMRDDQLLKLKTENLKLGKCHNITFQGVANYIQKCLNNLHGTQVFFSFAFPMKVRNFDQIVKEFDVVKVFKTLTRLHGKAVIRSSSENYHLLIKYNGRTIEGRTVTTSFSPMIFPKKTFAIVEHVILETNKQHVVFGIYAKNFDWIPYKFSSPEALQKKLIEEISGINYIRKLTINNTSHNWKFRSLEREEQQITVGRLEVPDGDNIVNYLRQIEPVHLKEIVINDTVELGDICNLPQVLEVERFEAMDCGISSDQIANLNAFSIKIWASRHQDILKYGVNALLKKWVKSLNLHDYNFELSNFEEQYDSPDIFAGIENFETFDDGVRKVYLKNDNFPEFQMEVSFPGDVIIAKRIRRDQKDLKSI